MSFLTWRWDFPQKLQRSCSFESVGRTKRSPLSMTRPGASTQVTTRWPLARPLLLTRRRVASLQARDSLQRTPARGQLGSAAARERCPGTRPDDVSRAAVPGPVVVQVDRVVRDDVLDQRVVVGALGDVDAEVTVPAHGVIAEPHAVAVVDEDAGVLVKLARDRVVVHVVVGDPDPDVGA